MLLNSGWSTFPTYLMSTSYITFPIPSTGLCPVRWIQTTFSYMSSFLAILAHCSSLLTNILQVAYLSSWWKFPEGMEGSWHLEPVLDIFFQIQCNCYDFIQERSVIAYTCALTNPLNHDFKLYRNVCIALSVARSGNTTTILLN